MQSTDLESLYNKIEGHILLVGAYTQDLNLIKIIRSCRLKPYSIFDGSFQPGTRFEKHWVDEFGNSLKFEGKKPRIVLNDTQLIDNTKISTDLFFGNSINKTANNSKFALIAEGKQNDINFHVAAFYGQDEYLRVFMHDKKWCRISPLLLGINTIHELFKNLGSSYIIEIDKKRLDLHIDIDKCITTSLPPKKDISSYFNDKIITTII